MSSNIRKNIELRKKLTEKFKAMLDCENSPQKYKQISLRVDKHKFSLGSEQIITNYKEKKIENNDIFNIRQNSVLNNTFTRDFWKNCRTKKKYSLPPNKPCKTLTNFHIGTPNQKYRKSNTKIKIPTTSLYSVTPQKISMKTVPNKRLIFSSPKKFTTIADYLDETQDLIQKLKTVPNADIVKTNSMLIALKNMREMNKKQNYHKKRNKSEMCERNNEKNKSPEIKLTQKLKNFGSPPPSSLVVSHEFDQEFINYKDKLELLLNIDLSAKEPLIICEITKLLLEREYKILWNCAAYESNYSSSLRPFHSSEIEILESFFNSREVNKSQNIQYIDQMLNERFYFSGLRKYQRINMLQNTVLFRLMKNETFVYKKAEISSIFYVIQGKVKIFNENNEYSRIIKFGQIFAEDLFFETKFNNIGYTKHYYDKFSIICVEDNTYILSTPREQFDKIISKELRNELFRKLYTLKKCRLFKEIPIDQLLQMTSRIQIKSCHYWELLQKQNEEPSKCYIISQGLCRAVYELNTVGNQLPKECIRKYMVKPIPPLKFGNTSSKFNENENYLEKYQYKEDEFYKTNNAKGVKMKFKYNIDFGVLKEGDYLCSRIFMKDKPDTEIEHHSNSQLSIYSDTSDVFILIISYEALLALDTKYIVFFINFPRKICKSDVRVKVEENMRFESDRPWKNPEEFNYKIQQAEQWRNYRENVKKDCLLAVINQRKIHKKYLDTGFA